MNEGSSKGTSALQAGAYVKSFVPGKSRFSSPRIEPFILAPGIRALVLSPHPDDDVFGCGGTMCKFGRTGTRFKVVYMTDGRFGSDSIPEEALVPMRRKEAIEALRVLGCSEYVFLDNRDLGLVCNVRTVENVRRILEDFEPGVIFLPPFEDFHPDHATTGRVAARALCDYEEDTDCLFYEVMTPIIPNTFVDITDVIDKKDEAIHQHRSQLDVADYSEKIRGLNAYRSLNMERQVRYCEAFHKCSRQELIGLAKDCGVLMA